MRILARMAVAIVWLCASPLYALTDTENDIIALENAIAEAVLNADMAFLDNNYADDFMFTHGTGSVQTKSLWLAVVERGDYWTDRRVEQIEVELHKNVAITKGRIYSSTNSDDPRWSEYMIWYVRVYQLRDGQWRLLSHTTTQTQHGPLDAPD